MPAPYIIDIKSISFNQIKADIKTWATSLPDYNQYRLFYEDEAGDIIFDLVAGFAAYCAYNDIASTKENYLAYCQNKAAAIGITSNYAYNSFRGINDHIQLRVTPAQNRLVDKFEQVGVVNGIPISAVNSYVFIAGESITIECVIGFVEERQLIAPSSKLYVFRYAEPNVSFDIKVDINGAEVPYTNSIKDMLKDYWYVQTNAFGGVDLYYLNESLVTPIYPYTTGDLIRITYIKHGNISYDFQNDIKFNYGILLDSHPDTKILFTYKTVESLESIQINGPLHNETGDTIKAREDYPKYFKVLDSDFVDTNSRDVYLPVIYLSQPRAIPAFLDVTYIKKDGTLLSPSNKAILLDKLTAAGARAHNIPSTEIVDPKEVDVRFDLILTLEKDASNATANDDIAAIFKYYTDERGLRRNREQGFKYFLNLNDLERDLEKLLYIKVARVDIFKKLWSSASGFKRGDFILPSSTVLPYTTNGFMYEVISGNYVLTPSLPATPLNNVNTIIPKFGSEPTWPTTQGEFVYENVLPWAPGVPYALNAIVSATPNNNLLYKVVVAGTSGPNPPNWNQIINTLNTDNNITWQVISPYDVTDRLIYKTHALDHLEFTSDWNEYYKFNYGPTITWKVSVQ